MQPRVLIGREEECARIDGLIGGVRLSASGVLVLRGEPGIGKTALLEHAARHADGLRLLTARGVESEVEIAFAGLFELLRPALDALDALPAPQAAALRGALGIGPPVGGDRRLVGAATLGVLSALAEERPLLVLVDDVHWLDPASAAALVFAARRLVADPVGLLLAVRAGEPSALDGAELPEIELGGLDADAAGRLLSRVASESVAPPVARWIVRATGGNPLALVELAREAPALRPDLVDAPVPVGARIERALGRRVTALSREAQLALLVAAGDDRRDVATVVRALAALGASLGALEEAEDAGLVRLEGGRVRFRHPLVRSAAYGLGSPSQQRAAHGALAAALAGDPDVDRRAWHEAAATVLADEGVARRLAEAAARARERSGYAASATGFARAADLTPDRARRARRLLAAAEGAWLAGDARRALDLLDALREPAPDPAVQADAAHLRGHVLTRVGPLPVGVRVLREGAELAAPVVPATACEMFAEAVYAGFYGGDPQTMAACAQRVAELAERADPRRRALAEIAQGAAGVMGGDAAAGMLHMRRAAEVIAAAPELETDPRLAAWMGIAPLFLRDTGAEYAPLRRAVGVARARGALGALPHGLFNLASEAAGGDRWPEAVALYGEGVELARETGMRVDLVTCLAGLARVEARQGAAGAAREHAGEALALAEELGMPAFAGWALGALGDAAWIAGDVEAAIAALERKAGVLAAAGLRDVDLSPAPELVEAYLRVGRTEDARAQAAAHAAQAAAKGQPWALARAERAWGLLAAGDGFERPFAAAVATHERTPDRFELARTRLLLGERRRRSGRRAEARAELRAALEAFETLGAAPWAERARQELAATGETARRRTAATLDQLTPQELRIALLLAEGATTRQAAEALYLSPKTIEYHLRHAYLKLGVNDRSALARALGRAQSSSATSPAARVAAPGAIGR